MTDDSDKPQDDTGQIDLIGPSGGERLAAARREQKVAIAEIAKELHISEEKVEALERNEFELLGAAVFARGYMRKYAQLVRLDADEILSDYAELTAAVDSQQPVIKARPRPRREMSPGPWIAVIVIIIAVVTAYWVFTTGPAWLGLGAPVEQETPLVNQLPEASAGTSEQTADEVAADEQGASTGAEDDVVDEAAADQTLVEQTLDEEPASAPPEPEPLSASPDNGEMQLLLIYSGDCWTEISDATGRRLYFGLGTDGRTVELRGTAPFDVLLGNANNVSLQLNGSVYVIDSIDRLGRARFSVAGN